MVIEIYFLLCTLELRQYKNDSIQSKNIPVLKLTRFFTCCLGDEKARQFQNWNFFLTEWSHSYIALALEKKT